MLRSSRATLKELLLWINTTLMTLSKSILLTVTHARKQQKMEVRKQQNSTGCLGGQAAVHTVISTCGRKKLIIQL